MKQFFVILFLLVFFVPVVRAADTKTDYTAEYYLQAGEKDITSRVKLTIKLTNLSSNKYVKTISLTFPSTFAVDNLKALDDTGPVYPDITKKEDKAILDLTFNDPAVGKNTVNTFSVEYEQNNLFKMNGNIWEVILPTIEDDTRVGYNVIVHLPDNTDKKIAIAKPKPDKITGDQIIWTNPKEKTIYAVFGNEQNYNLKLAYHLDNPKIIPVYTDIALPPDTLFQKTYINDLSPKPSEVFLDTDDNLIARYILKPRENITVQYQGVTKIFSQSRPEVRDFVASEFEKQKDYLTKPQKYWTLENFDTASFSSPQDIFGYVVNKLSYDYDKVSKSSSRMGAQEALNNPKNAVCTEFTDTFIAIARAKGIPTREIQGYGFSQDDKLRPLSLTSDILHAWPEYYDTENGIWMPIDPTWQNTSGIDYFSSFDLNHVALAIHGKQSDYPYPAGSYKYQESKDIDIATTANQPTENLQLELVKTNLPKQITDNKIYTATLRFRNEGNVYAWGIPMHLQTTGLQLTKETVIIPVIPPFGERDVNFEYKAAQQNKRTTAQLHITLGDNKILDTTINVFPYAYKVALEIAISASAIVAFITLLILLKKVIFPKRS